jgi:hypothetical protein
MIKTIFPLIVNDNEKRFVVVDNIVDFGVIKIKDKFELNIRIPGGEYKSNFTANTEQEIMAFIFANFMERPKIVDDPLRIEQKGKKFYLYENGKKLKLEFLTEKAAKIQMHRIKISRLLGEGN